MQALEEARDQVIQLQSTASEVEPLRETLRSLGEQLSGSREEIDSLRAQQDAAKPTATGGAAQRQDEGAIGDAGWDLDNDFDACFDEAGPPASDAVQEETGQTAKGLEEAREELQSALAEGASVRESLSE